MCLLVGMVVEGGCVLMHIINLQFVYSIVSSRLFTVTHKDVANAQRNSFHLFATFSLSQFFPGSFDSKVQCKSIAHQR